MSILSQLGTNVLFSFVDSHILFIQLVSIFQRESGTWSCISFRHKNSHGFTKQIRVYTEGNNWWQILLLYAWNLCYMVLWFCSLLLLLNGFLFVVLTKSLSSIGSFFFAACYWENTYRYYMYGLVVQINVNKSLCNPLRGQINGILRAMVRAIYNALWSGYKNNALRSGTALFIYN